MMNIINGGAHADNPIDFQEFMIMPVGAESFARRCAWGAEVFHTLKKALHEGRPQHQCRRRGRLRAEPAVAEEALDFIMKAIEKAGYKPGEDVVSRSTAPRPSSSRTASTSWKARARRSIPRSMAKYLADSRAAIPIVSIEDGMAEDDWDGWKR
jgi:enolase